jgi:aspartyl-tRNA(Asn)/glutamyl-tRNA(Gln) amidotransferase subunit C
VSVDPKDVARVASLAQLSLSADEAERLTGELNQILEHVDDLRGLELVELSDLTPQLRTPLPSTRSAEGESRDEMTGTHEAGAPDVRDGFFVVPPPPGLEQKDPR